MHELCTGLREVKFFLVDDQQINTTGRDTIETRFLFGPGRIIDLPGFFVD